MTRCQRQSSSDIELYFYGELEAAERSAVERHLRSCSDCRQALEELSTIRAALAARPRVDAPAETDWTRFMQRLDRAVHLESRGGPTVPAVRQGPQWKTYLAMAAVLALVTSGVIYVARSTSRPASSAPVESQATVPSQTPPQPAAIEPVEPFGHAPSPEAAFTALSEQHFERSKLVVLGLANKDPHHAREADWAFERGLASSLLSDTRLYRQAAEARGMKSIAGVMGDLELVLLQTSLADAPDAEALERIQRLIHKRDLVPKMEVAATTGS
jgi:Putative zinc-finger